MNTVLAAIGGYTPRKKRTTNPTNLTTRRRCCSGRACGEWFGVGLSGVAGELMVEAQNFYAQGIALSSQPT